MNLEDIQALEARKSFGELLERVYYQARQFRITRKDKPMARLVSEPFMQAIDRLIADDPGLADTIAVMLNDDILQALAEGEEDFIAGRHRVLTR